MFLSFVSMGRFEVAPVKKMVVGLERGECKSCGWYLQTCRCFQINGFPAQIKQRGLLVRNWGLQVAVLNHRTVVATSLTAAGTQYWKRRECRCSNYWVAVICEA